MGYIKAIYIDNKTFLTDKRNNKGLCVSFSDAMNCIIGGRGSGKTTILDTIGFLLSQNVENKNILEKICKQGSAGILYSFKNEDYYIIFNSDESDEENNKIFISRCFNRGMERRYKFNEKIARKDAIRDRFSVFKENGRVEITPKNFLDKIYSRNFSVNNLVNIAGSSEINNFIYELISKDKSNFKKLEKEKFQNYKELETCYRKLQGKLDNRNKKINNLISDFNSKQRKKLKLVYTQNSLNDIEFPWAQILNINYRNKDEYFKGFGITCESVKNFLEDLSVKKDPIKIVLLFIKEKYKELEQIINILNYIEIYSTDTIESTKIIEEKNISEFMNVLSKVIYNSIESLIEFYDDYYEKIDNFNLEFNINNREVSATIPSLFKEVSQLSMGQKVVAMLSFILSYNEYSNDKSPLIIDQPEDNLDNQYIHKNLVNDLKEVKRKRQIIISTHNSTIVTSTQAEQVIVMESDNSNGWINVRGFPTEKKIINHIINHLEGGKDSFNHKTFLYRDVLEI